MGILSKFIVSIIIVIISCILFTFSYLLNKKTKDNYEDNKHCLGCVLKNCQNKEVDNE